MGSVTERRLVVQGWYETEYSKNGWESYGWQFMDTGHFIDGSGYEVTQILDSDKHYNPILGIAEKETEIDL